MLVISDHRKSNSEDINERNAEEEERRREG